jgi:hypothetical protein
MKSKILKLGMPLMAIAFAILGAFASNAGETKDLAPAIGYLDAPEPCSVAIECDTTVGPICTDEMGVQAFGKLTPASTSCSKVLYRAL